MPQKSFFKKFVLLFSVCCLALAVSGCGSSFHFSRKELLNGASRTISGSRQLRVGEKLTYQIRWMGIPVGIAVFNVKELAQINGRDCYHIMVSVTSNAFLSKIYRVDDEFHSYIDKENLYSLRFSKKQSEGRYRSNEQVDYDQQAHKGVHKSFLNNSTKEVVIAENSQDDLSAIYYFRMQDIEVGKPFVMNVNADEKNWILEIDVLQRGTMSLSVIGSLEAIEVEPCAKTTEGKPLNKGKMWIWFGADENRIPLAALARAAIVGTVTAVLTKVE